MSNVNTKTRLYLCYHRTDIDFAKKLGLDYHMLDYDVWVDWGDISPTDDDWFRRIELAIDASDVFIFIISSDSVESEVHIRQINYATNMNKRIIPILWKEPYDSYSKLLPVIESINWIWFDKINFDYAISTLLKTIEYSSHHVEQFNYFLKLAQDWEHHGRHHDFLLNKVLLMKAQEWLKQFPDKQPRLTPLHREFIQASKQANIGLGERLFTTLKKLPRLMGQSSDRKIVISYRESDNRHIRDRIYDKLLKDFQQRDIVMVEDDVTAVPFEQVIDNCAVLLVVIGKTWMTSKEDDETESFLMREDDIVRKDIEFALQRSDLRVMPLLVNGTSMPASTEIPSSMQDFLQMNASVIRPGRDFHNDMNIVIRHIKGARQIFGKSQQ